MSADEQQVSDHPMVLAAVARLCREGGWQRVLDKRALTDPLDIADAELLAAAGVFERGSDGGGFALARTDGWLGSPPEAIGAGATALLRRALRHALGAGAGWTDDDRELLLAQGRGSAGAGQVLVERILPQLNGARERLAGPSGRFLDVGVGVGGLAIRLCELLPTVRVTGIDVLPAALELAGQEIAGRGLDRRIETRKADVAQLEDTDEYDVAWLPQPFIPPPALREGLDRLRRALAPGGWLVMPIKGPDPQEGPLADALARHAGQLLGGGLLGEDEARELLEGKGYAEVDVLTAGPLTVAVGRRDEG